jgi:hypothetical protein
MSARPMPEILPEIHSMSEESKIIVLANLQFKGG